MASSATRSGWSTSTTCSRTEWGTPTRRGYQLLYLVAAAAVLTGAVPVGRIRGVS